MQKEKNKFDQKSSETRLKSSETREVTYTCIYTSGHLIPNSVYYNFPSPCLFTFLYHNYGAHTTSKGRMVPDIPDSY